MLTCKAFLSAIYFSLILKRCVPLPGTSGGGMLNANYISQKQLFVKTDICR